ncbi:uncharacterized protein (TIGR03083 family) [Kribbella antiqua]|uniref:Uncharacterized protein (TIGR03083 family) n=1 Tax=Kribbella antiqua TaxID=2512217 RepID=A0A4R2IK96_9ACTN|nr:uncharacterized protein (TIGR03083 family) [Kribbella antiqua]
MARTGAAPGDDDFRDPTHRFQDPADADGLQDWLTAGARELAKTLRAVGPDVPITMPIENPTTRFTARRMTHETAIHRADAVLALGLDYDLDAEAATDALDEWMELGTLPLHFEVHPWMRELLGPGRTLGFHATDVATTWTVDLTGDAIRWSRSDAPAAVAVRGPLVELLLTLYKRRAVDGDRIEVHGDRDLLDYYLERVSFG